MDQRLMKLAAIKQATERANRESRPMNVHVLESGPGVFVEFPVWYVTCPDAGERPHPGSRHIGAVIAGEWQDA